MITPHERFAAVLNKEDPIDRLPKFEIGAVTLPLMKMITRYHKLPSFLKKTLRSLDLIREMVSYLKKFYLGIELKQFKPKKKLKIFPKRLLTNFINLSRTEENFEKIVNTVYKIPIKLGYDGWGLPNPLLLDFMGKVIRKDNMEYGICFVDGKIWDLDLETGDMIEVGLLYDNDEELMIKYYTNFMESFDFERHYGAIENALNQKVGDRRLKEAIVPILFIRGLMSTWLYAFPTAKMSLFFKYVFDEFRRKGDAGMYGKFLQAKTKWLMKHVDYLAKLELPALLLGDDQAGTHGPYFRPPIYKKVYKPLYSELTKHAHSKGVKIIMHSDGRFKTNSPEDPTEEGWDFLDGCIIDQGIDAWHSVEMGANDTYEIKEHVKGRLALIGSIDTKWLQYYDPTTVRRLVYQHLKGFLTRGGLDGFIPASDNSIIAKTRIESWLSMIKTIDDFSMKYITKGFKGS
ncbi:MAG: hypothetical protein HWN66_02015 [Candidatus Helarchaeota archaeon]|nr:hypothetical protein [Candidatus Helarchaeota archaeon]